MNSGESAPANISQIEDVALKTVTLMEKCVGVIRSTDQFDLAVVAKQKKENFSLGNVRLFSRMEEQGIVEKLSSIMRSSKTYLPNLSFDHHDIGIQNSERSKLVHKILLPLISLLSTCYEVIDQFPNTSIDVSAQNSKRKTKEKKPKPPRGMLSIQNYTDVAAFLEFTVCSCALPHLQDQVLTPVEERARYHLPKSLAGRIPQLSLLWGCAIEKKTIQPNLREVAAFELKSMVLVLGAFVLLDRFRPMLLPRHLSDLYAAIFQAEEYELELKKVQEKKAKNVFQFESLRTSTKYNVVYESLFPGDSQAGSATHVDAYFRARAYQSLLLRGTKAPLWLRRRVSKLLTDLAARDLAAVVQVFVLAATNSSEDMTGASMRLSKALIGPSLMQPDTESIEYQKRLCQQLVQLLDLGGVSVKNADTHNMDPRQVAGILTVWSALDLFPTNILQYFSKLLGDGLIPDAVENRNNDNDDHREYVIHRSVRRITSLLMCAPSSGNHHKACKLFLWPRVASNRLSAPDSMCNANIFGQLLRLASTPIVLKSVIKDEAALCLHQLLRQISQSRFPSSNKTGNKSIANGPTIAAMSIVYAIAPNTTDFEGYQYHLNSPDESDGSSLSRVFVKQDSNNIAGIESISSGVERRTKVIVSLLVPLCETIEEKEIVTHHKTGQDATSLLPSRLFHLLLLLYFQDTTSSTELQGENNFTALPIFFYENLSLATMNLLPLLCECCPPHSLLLDDDDGRNGIMGLIKLILNCACFKFGGNNDTNLQKGEQDSSAKNDLISRSVTMFCDILSISANCGDHKGDQHGLTDDHESLLSVTSVVLSMLIAILELGSNQRPEKEEQMFTTVATLLKVLAVYSEDGVSLNVERSSSVARTDLAEMASHALALISSRSAPIIAEILTSDRPDQISVFDKIAQAEKDLSSEQPPIRARGVVSLRHLARGYLEEHISASSQSRPLVEIIDGENLSTGGKEKEVSVLLDVLRLSIRALDDNESYVYLAGIQTLVAAADVNPQQVLPLLARALCIGDFESTENSETIYLNNAQRVKLAESLLFTIRRRGNGIYQYVPHLLDQMLGIKEKKSSGDSRVEDDIKIQRKTHEYFISGGDSNVEDLETLNDEQSIRVNTGGPVFDVEEDDLVRAAFISVLTELVSVSQPRAVSYYCPALMRLIIDVLHMDTSRPIRRTAALLCREMYGCVLREYNENVSSNFREDDLKDLDGYSLAVEMLISGEGALFSILQSCVSGKDDREGTVCDGGKRYAYDPAAVARCEEAIAKRSQAENEGIFVAANLFAESKKQVDQNPIARILRSERKGEETVRAMQGLSVDSNNLKLG